MQHARLKTADIQSALRQKNIGNVEDVELAILEPNVKIATSLKPNKAPATKEDIQKILDI
ncbi:YetF domain-containing protein [Peribacillus frigoritolerans]|uniref:YetF domain-containing protein n=1 Tax=Peribacillus frigoritolerans TaxID=450367 RepID=UPI0035E39523